MDQIITDRPSSSKLYNDIIELLTALTGIQWGYVRGRSRIKYISSVELPLRVGVTWGKVYEKRIKLKLDIEISNKMPKLFTCRELWADAVNAELVAGLLKSVTDPQICERIKLWKPKSELAALIIHASKQNELHKIG